MWKTIPYYFSPLVKNKPHKPSELCIYSWEQCCYKQIYSMQNAILAILKVLHSYSLLFRISLLRTAPIRSKISLVVWCLCRPAGLIPHQSLLYYIYRCKLPLSVNTFAKWWCFSLLWRKVWCVAIIDLSSLYTLADSIYWQPLVCETMKQGFIFCLKSHNLPPLPPLQAMLIFLGHLMLCRSLFSISSLFPSSSFSFIFCLFLSPFFHTVLFTVGNQMSSMDPFVCRGGGGDSMKQTLYISLFWTSLMVLGCMVLCQKSRNSST